MKPTVSWLNKKAYHMDTTIHNNAVMDGRLFSHYPQRWEQKLNCKICGEQLWQYPKPEYWMQYPTPNVLIIDEMMVCSDKCVEDHLLNNPYKKGQQLELFDKLLKQENL